VLNDTMQGMVMLIGTIVLLVGVSMPRAGCHAVETLQRSIKLVSRRGG
jgi:sodium/pantothenate symporter